MEYIIVGDTKDYTGCLVSTCGKKRERAEEVLNQMLTNPTPNQQFLMRGHTNLRIEEVEDKDCWWNDPFLCN